MWFCSSDNSFTQEYNLPSSDPYLTWESLPNVNESPDRIPLSQRVVHSPPKNEAKKNFDSFFDSHHGPIMNPIFNNCTVNFYFQK